MSSDSPKITEGYMPFLDYKVYYRVVGEKNPTIKSLFFYYMVVQVQLIIISRS